MAAVTAELRGRPGAVLVSLGPGAASAVNGVAYASLDRAPVVVLTDRHPREALRFTTHQVIDHERLLAPVVKASFLGEARSAATTMKRAVRLALADPRGPVHVELPADVGGAASRRAGTVQPATRPRPILPLTQAARRLAHARRPVILAGLECRGRQAADNIRALAERLAAPVLTTYKAKGVVPDEHPLHLGILTGGALEEGVIGLADCIVALGLDVVELIPRRWPYRAPVIHLGPTAPGGRYYRPVARAEGDAGDLAKRLRAALPGTVATTWDASELRRLKDDQRRRMTVASDGLAPHRVVRIARELTPAGSIATVDAGAHMFPATTFWGADEPGSFLISNGLATMGFALPAAIAAQLEHPDRRVVCLTGDGGLTMVAGELETVQRLGLPLVVVVFNDLTLSLIQIKQVQKAYRPDGTTYVGPSFPDLARSFGIEPFVATSEPELKDAFASALAQRRPALIDARIDPSGYLQTMEVLRGQRVTG
jgi:acetolactate synthase-1/2/3 large subunit